MGRADIRFWDMVKLFAKAGALSFGGWSTTSLLLEKEFVEKRKLLTPNHFKGAVAYAQILPGATQVSIVSNAGYQLRGFVGAGVATVSYLLPAIGLIIIFAALYFHYVHDSSQLVRHLGGLVAALSGVILANAYRIGSKHVTSTWLWLLVAIAFLAKLLLGVNALFIILAFGVAGLLLSWIKVQKASDDR